MLHSNFNYPAPFLGYFLCGLLWPNSPQRFPVWAFVQWVNMRVRGPSDKVQFLRGLSLQLCALLAPSRCLPFAFIQWAYGKGGPRFSQCFSKEVIKLHCCYPTFFLPAPWGNSGWGNIWVVEGVGGMEGGGFNKPENCICSIGTSWAPAFGRTIEVIWHSVQSLREWQASRYKGLTYE